MSSYVTEAAIGGDGNEKSCKYYWIKQQIERFH